MAIRDILVLGESILRQRSEPVPENEISSKPIQTLIDDMLETASQSPEGSFITAGLAAPQVGESLRIFLALKEGSKRNSPEYEIYINPELEFPSSELTESKESCLSTPGLCGIVRRYPEVHITYFDRDGNKQRQKLSDDHAIFVQHEYDHLDGILWIDNVVDTKSIRFC